MKKTLLSVLVALCAAISASAQTFEWGTATWNIEDGKTYADIDEFNEEGVVLTYPNPAEYSLTFLNIILVEYNVYVDGSDEPIEASSSAQASTAVSMDYDFVEGHSYKLVTTKAKLVQANLATRTTDTLSVNTDSYTISFSIAGPELVKTYEVEGTMALSIVDQEGDLTFSTLPVDEICTTLGIESIADAKVYGLNQNGSYNIHFSDYYDGWRDNAGEYTTYWSGWDSYVGHNAYKSVYCIKLNETCDTVSYYYYDYWKEYDPDADESIGGSTIGSAKHRAAPAVNYNHIIWDWVNEDGTVTQYDRAYNVEEGSDYNAAFIIIANKKAVKINATLHFVTQEAYAEYIKTRDAKTYSGYLSAGIAMMQAPGQALATNGTEQTVTITPGEAEGTSVVTFSGFTFPMLNMPTGELAIYNVTTATAEDGSITYESEPATVGITRGSMIVNYTATLTGTQASADAVPTFTLTLTQATAITAIFTADQASAEAALSQYYQDATAISSVSADDASATEIYSLNGVRQSALSNGINIVKKNGKTIKVLK